MKLDLCLDFEVECSKSYAMVQGKMESRIYDFSQVVKSQNSAFARCFKHPEALTSPLRQNGDRFAKYPADPADSDSKKRPQPYMVCTAREAVPINEPG